MAGLLHASAMRAPVASATRCAGLGATWAYRAVVCAWLWPSRCPITGKLQQMYFDCVTGKSEKHADWLTLVK